MGKPATAGTCLASPVKMAMPLCKQAERECPRTGPGRKPVIAERGVAVLAYGRCAQTKKGQIGAISIPRSASPGTVKSNGSWTCRQFPDTLD